MKVIKHGKNYIRYGKCSCGCEFEYDRKDVMVYKQCYGLNDYGSEYWSEHGASKKEIKEGNNLNYYVTCPECGGRVIVDREI